MAEIDSVGISNILPIAYLSALVLTSLYSIHKTIIIWRFMKYRHKGCKPLKSYDPSELPAITVQLPIFNEVYVVERLIEAVSNLNYPADKLQIQVLDDSTDETQEICRRKVKTLKQRSLDIHYIYRQDRQGYKAGALEQGLKSATGELVCIFDADFIPMPDTLKDMVDHFTDPEVGMVQARWVHLNRDYSLLTEIQALMLDGHFILEQIARNRSGCFFNFNGTAGLWRIETIRDAGGWQRVTVTEDLDLSYRVQLKGWKCVYLPDVTVPAELPVEMNAFKSQQFRWAKGASQVARKLLRDIFQSDNSLKVKLEAFLHLTNNFNYLLLLSLLLLSLPYQGYVFYHQVHYGPLIYLPLFFGNLVMLLCFYLIPQREQGLMPSPEKLLYRIFFLMSIGVGISVNQSFAVCEGLIRQGTEFVRTPKHGITHHHETWLTKKYRGAKTQIVLLEIIMFVYLIITTIATLSYGHYLSLPFLLMFVIGYGYVLSLSLVQQR